MYARIDLTSLQNITVDIMNSKGDIEKEYLLEKPNDLIAKHNERNLDKLFSISVKEAEYILASKNWHPRGANFTWVQIYFGLYKAKLSC